MGIALSYGMSTGELKTLNNFSSNIISIFPGQKIKVYQLPDASPTLNGDKTEEADSTDRIAHIVTQSETLILIGQKYNVKVEEIMELNNLSSFKLTTGQILYVQPPKAGDAAASPKPSLSRQSPTSIINPSNSQNHKMIDKKNDQKKKDNKKDSKMGNNSNNNNNTSVIGLKGSEVGKKNINLKSSSKRPIPSVDLKESKPSTILHNSYETIEGVFSEFFSEFSPKNLPTIHTSYDSYPKSFFLKKQNHSSSPPNPFPPLNHSSLPSSSPIEFSNIESSKNKKKENPRKEFCRYLLPNSKKSALGYCTITDKFLKFEPTPHDPLVAKIGYEKCSFCYEYKDLIYYTPVDESNVDHPEKGLPLEYGSTDDLKYLCLTLKNDPISFDLDMTESPTYSIYLEFPAYKVKGFTDMITNAILMNDLRIKDELRKPKIVKTIFETDSVPVKEPPRLIGETNMLDRQIESLISLRESLPIRFRSSSLTLLYNSREDGLSYVTFFRKLCGYDDTIIFIEDDAGHIFGGYCSSEWRQSDCYFGSGENFVFKYYPYYCCYNWVQTNEYFMLTRNNHITLGGGGTPAIWLDEEFNVGMSGKSETYKNDTLSHCTDFIIHAIEVWAVSAYK